MKHTSMLKATFLTLAMLICNLVFSQTCCEKELANCPKKGTADCPIIKKCIKEGKMDQSAAAAELDKCPQKGTADCPLIKNCPKKGTADCPYTKQGGTAAVPTGKKEAELPACCKKKH